MPTTPGQSAETTLLTSILNAITGLWPAAAAPADGESNATALSKVRAALSGFNGTTWDRARAGVTGVVAGVTGWLNVLPGAQYIQAGVTLADGQWTSLLTTIAGFLKVSLGDDIGGENRSLQRMLGIAPFNYTRLSANGTTTIKSGVAYLVGFIVWVPGASANTLILYDNTAASGTQISGTIDTTGLAKGQFVGVPGGAIQCNTGLTAILATGTSADITVVWLPG